MTALVLDASVAVAWHFEDDGSAMWDLLARVAESAHAGELGYLERVVSPEPVLILLLISHKPGFIDCAEAPSETPVSRAVIKTYCNFFIKTFAKNE